MFSALPQRNLAVSPPPASTAASLTLDLPSEKFPARRPNGICASRVDLLECPSMFERIGSFLRKKPPQKGGPLLPEPTSSPSPNRDAAYRGQTFTKVFRWRLPDGQMKEPKSVEVVGSFTRWQRVQLTRDSVLDAWHVTLHHIQGNRTHHYMLLVDGEPFYDKTCDGLAVPHGADEERYSLKTERGPRMLMLFAQTK